MVQQQNTRHIDFSDLARYIPVMGKSELANRLKRTGVTQRELARRVGVTAQAVNDGFKRGIQRYEALIDLLERTPADQRREWLKGH